MFYIKSEVAEGVTIRTEITDNVFTVCPECGSEHCVELDDILKCEHTNLYSTSVYCDECSKRRAVKGMTLGRRELNLEQWRPDEADKPTLVAYFLDFYEGIKECCGDGEEAAEALELYKLVKNNPLRYAKGAIQEHFVDAFHAVGGEIEKYYDKSPEMIHLINLTVCPDPLEEV